MQEIKFLFISYLYDIGHDIYAFPQLYSNLLLSICRPIFPPLAMSISEKKRKISILIKGGRFARVILQRKQLGISLKRFQRILLMQIIAVF